MMDYQVPSMIATDVQHAVPLGCRLLKCTVPSLNAKYATTDRAVSTKEPSGKNHLYSDAGDSTYSGHLRLSKNQKNYFS